MARLMVPIVVVLATALAGASVVSDLSGGARVVVVLAFAVVVPGLGWAWRLRLADAGDAVLAAVTISICLLVVVGEGMALLRLWSVQGGFLVLAAVALLGVALPRREPTPRTGARRDPDLTAEEPSVTGVGQHAGDRR